MKKTIISFLVSSFLCLPSFGLGEHYDEQYLNWATFCPAGYTGSMYREESARARSIGYSLLFTGVFTYWGIMLIREENEKKVGNYWFIRRRKFQDCLSACNEIEDNDNRIKCHIKVRELEDNLNNRQEINVYSNPYPVFIFW